MVVKRHGGRSRKLNLPIRRNIGIRNRLRERGIASRIVLIVPLDLEIIVFLVGIKIDGAEVVGGRFGNGHRSLRSSDAIFIPGTRDIARKALGGVIIHGDLVGM